MPHLSPMPWVLLILESLFILVLVIVSLSWTPYDSAIVKSHKGSFKGKVWYWD